MYMYVYVYIYIYVYIYVYIRSVSHPHHERRVPSVFPPVVSQVANKQAHATPPGRRRRQCCRAREQGDHGRARQCRRPQCGGAQDGLRRAACLSGRGR